MKHSTFQDLNLSSEEYFNALGRQFCVYTESICYVHLLFELKRDLVNNNIVCQLPISDLYPLSNIGIKMDAQAQPAPFKIFSNKSIAANDLISSGGYYQLDIVIPRVR